MDAKKRVRKKDSYQMSWFNTYGNYGESSGGVTQSEFHYSASNYTQRNWIEDTNHREHYTIDGRNFDVATIKGTMTTADRGSPMWLRRSIYEWPRTWFGGRKYVIGNENAHNFTRFYAQGAQIFDPLGKSGLVRDGQIYRPFYGSFPNDSVMIFDSINPKAWRRYKPLNPEVSTSQFLGELRELPRAPFILFERAKFFRSIPSDYLNWEFGWRPFIKDLISFCEAYFLFDQRYAQLVRDNGKPVRRRGSVFMDIDTKTEQDSRTSSTIDKNSPVQNLYLYPSPMKGSLVSRKYTTSQKYTFSARFRYYLQPVESARYKEQIARIIYGVDLTPRLLYELFPWSWLLSWATTVGDSINNMTENILDGLVADYAYSMGHYRYEIVHTCIGPLTTCDFIQTSEIKARVQATPYGFGLSPGSFTSRQKAILAALLLARS